MESPKVQKVSHWLSETHCLNECWSLVLEIILFQNHQSPSVSIVHPTSWGQHKLRNNILMKTNRPNQHVGPFHPHIPPPNKKTRKTPSRPVDSEDVLLAPQSSVGSEFPWRLRLSTSEEVQDNPIGSMGKKILLLSMGNPGWLIGILTHRIHVWNIYHYIPTFGWFLW